MGQNQPRAAVVQDEAASTPSGSDRLESSPGSALRAPPARRRRALVIGAGSSGLAAIQQALEAGLEPVCCEARPGVGGAWRYDSDPGPCEWRFGEDGEAQVFTPGESDVQGKPPPSPMYASLRTNVPTTLMQYRATPFPRTVGLFCKHDEVQQYLEDFAEPFLPYIRFDTRVVSVRHTLDTASNRDGAPPPADSDSSTSSSSRRRWTASFRSTLRNDAPLEEQQFDAVFVANGHYSRPYIPPTEGLQSFPGELLHARWYRDAGQFEQKTVLVVGNSASGYDITRELATSIYTRRQQGSPEETLPRIYQSARSPPALGIPWDAPDAPEHSKEVQTFPPIRKMDGRTIHFVDGRYVSDVDTIIFATGYFFSFPFLSPTSAPFSEHPVTYAPPKASDPSGRPPQPSVHGGLRIHNLDDRMLFYLPDPTLAFLGLPYLVIPFPLAQIQARLAALHFASSPLLPQPLIFRPNPSMAGPNGEEDGAPEVRATVTLGHPKQFDLHDRMLRETGDVQEEEGEVKPAEVGGIWTLTSEADRDLRKGAKGLRKAVLGY